MKRTGSDWWKLYHDDFWDDEHVLKLSAAQAGVYLFLLGLQAKHGKLPEDPESVALLCRRFWKRRTEWDALWAVLERFFPTSDALRARFNPRQAFELTEIEADRGKETGRKARWRASQAGLSRDCPGGTNADVPVERRGEEKRGDKKRGEESSPRAKRTRDKPVQTHARKLVSDYWCGAFQRARSAPYAWQGGTDGGHLTRVLALAQDDVAEVQRRIDRFLADPFWQPKADFGKFVGQWNAMAGTQSRSILEIIANAGNGNHQ